MGDLVATAGDVAVLRGCAGARLRVALEGLPGGFAGFEAELAGGDAVATGRGLADLPGWAGARLRAELTDFGDELTGSRTDI